jgi:hypothetical protein
MYCGSIAQAVVENATETAAANELAFNFMHIETPVILSCDFFRRISQSNADA